MDGGFIDYINGAFCVFVCNAADMYWIYVLYVVWLLWICLRNRIFRIFVRTFARTCVRFFLYAFSMLCSIDILSETMIHVNFEAILKIRISLAFTADTFFVPVGTD